MIESFFGLKRRPFCVAPNLDFYVPTASCQGAIETSVRSVTRGEGPSLIIGGAGLGKTICAMKIAQKLSGSMQVVLLSSSQVCTRRALLQSILFHLGLEHQETDEGTLRIELHRRLSPPSASSPGVALVIDEAQSLSIKLLEEIRILSNTLSDGRPVVHLVLAGSLKLEDTLSHPQMESLNQRIVARNYLKPLSHPETLLYVRRKIELAQGNPDRVFEAAALDAIYRASEGIPRLIEQLADQAILQSGLESRKPIQADRIAAVWTQLHQLPNPWSQQTSTSVDPPSVDTLEPAPEDHLGDTPIEPDTEAAIEFCALDEEPTKPNFFEPFIQDPVNKTSPVSTSAGVSTLTIDKSFRQLVQELNLAAIELQPSDRVFAKANQEAKRIPTLVVPTRPISTTASCELVGISVDGDDRDMLVVIEDQSWVNPFAIR
jgi:type II secretory pathway predicted ATPase ExeA